jgi:hypothetical protein
MILKQNAGDWNIYRGVDATAPSLSNTNSNKRRYNMLTPEQDSMVSKILKLLELGKEDRNESEAQREAANRKAAELMARYSIDFADLREKKPAGMFHQVDLKMDTQPVMWEGSLAVIVSQCFDVRIVQRDWPWTLMFLGTKTDIEISVFFFKYLRRSIGIQAERKFMRMEDQEVFAYGAIDVINRRLQELYIKRNEVFNTNEKALMVIKTDALDEFVKEKFPKLHKSQGPILPNNPEAYYAGRNAGEKVNLSRPLQGSSSVPSGQIQG